MGRRACPSVEEAFRLLHENHRDSVKRIIDQTSRLDHHRKHHPEGSIACGIKLFVHRARAPAAPGLSVCSSRIKQVAMIERRSLDCSANPRTRLGDTGEVGIGNSRIGKISTDAREEMVCPVPGSKPHPSQFIAEEIETHRIDQIACEHIDRAALRTEGSWSIELARVLIAELHQVLDQTL